MAIIGQCEARPSSAAITEIAPDPKRINVRFGRGGQ
jgi:hypothetical protein